MTGFSRTFIAASVLAAILSSGGASALECETSDCVTPALINGSGNANGSFTIDRSFGIEVGLRGKLRHDVNGSPQNIFNSNGDGTYTFNAGVAPTQNFPTAEWSFEWSVNVDYLQGTNDGTGYSLSDLSYFLELDQDPTAGSADFVSFDPIMGQRLTYGSQFVDQWDHAIGDNQTANGEGAKVSNVDTAESPTTAVMVIEAAEAQYAALVSENNVAQNSWKPSWFIPEFNPEVGGEYEIRLSVYGPGNGSTGTDATTTIDDTNPTPPLIDPLASTSIRILVQGGTTPNGDVPVPATLALFGIGLLGAVASRRRQRRAR